MSGRLLHLTSSDAEGFATTHWYNSPMQLTAAVTHEAPWYVARCLDVDVVSQTLPLGSEAPIIATVLISA
jgi:hypothetical protein